MLTLRLSNYFKYIFQHISKIAERSVVEEQHKRGLKWFISKDRTCTGTFTAGVIAAEEWRAFTYHRFSPP